MSNIALVFEERAAKIGNFLVGRLLPFRQKRAVGPFVFIDHMGPMKMSEREQFDILPHPHIGLSTLTYLFEGSIMHRDSIGSEMEIKPGAVNWMTAGQGVVHSERTPDYLRASKKSLHGLQIWIALPKDMEDIAPSFTHVPEADIPSWSQDGLQFKLIAGEILGHCSAVPVHSPLFFIEIKATEKGHVSLGDVFFGESALYILEGEVHAEGNMFSAKQILIAENAKLCSFDVSEQTTVYIFGGEPFPERRFMDWNFVSSSKEKLQQAKADWIAQRFPKIEGEIDFVPYPGAGL